MLTRDFEYTLPEDMIAQVPIEPRDHSRLMLIDRSTTNIEHHHFHELPAFLKEGDVLVFNDSRVIPARLIGRKDPGRGRAEILLLRRLEPGLWEALARPGRRLKPGARVQLCKGTPCEAEIIAGRDGGIKIVRLSDESALPHVGVVPLPPYIHAPLADPERYQTVYARTNGSVAAPTAGLHFTPELLRKLSDAGVEMLFVTLHIGLDTFRPVAEEEAESHAIHKEYGEITEDTARKLNRAMEEGRRIVAVGTTTVRLLESLACRGLPLRPCAGEVDLFILPGFRFRVTNAMITNFHLPRSTLLMLVSAFAGRDLVLRAYEEAISHRYRFYSFGDCMIIL
ncbi:MAG: tRNA preQ1(34) S-adenosylmethionine ribosyltransferase-isomerase QueA [Chloroflexi bacterium]|nr:tRNA preQ1(34) S-adenosylmethionine ribosyltransferase-isomerase QueA [Chloroflexota bacterium]